MSFDENQEPLKSIKAGSGTVLIVDDQEIASEVVNDYLHMLGYSTYVVSSGAEALEFYSQNTNEIDLVLLDMIMPGMSGSETFAGLKKLNKNVRIILCSGYCEDNEAATLLSSGCKGFIQKPFSVEALSRKVESVLRDRGAPTPAETIQDVSDTIGT